MKAEAFTMTAPVWKPSIISPVLMRQSVHLCRTYNLICQEKNVSALWDTGATNSCISAGLVRHLGLKPVDICNISGVNGIHQAKVYQIDIVITPKVLINSVRVSEFIDNGEFEIIIGMDIITLGDFAISNTGGTTMSFRIPPRDEPIDFTKEV